MVILVYWVIKMPRIQVNISNETEKMLSTFNHPSDKRVFIENAIRLALENEELCKFFGIAPLNESINRECNMNTLVPIAFKAKPKLGEVTTKNPTLNPTEHKQVPGKICVVAKTGETNQIKIDSEFDTN